MAKSFGYSGISSVQSNDLVDFDTSDEQIQGLVNNAISDDEKCHSIPGDCSQNLGLGLVEGIGLELDLAPGGGRDETDCKNDGQCEPPVSTRKLKELLGLDLKESTLKTVRFAVTILSNHATSLGSSLADVENYSAKETDAFLAKFYKTMRRPDGSFYTQKSMQGIKFGLHRYFKKVHGWDIVRDEHFQESSNVYRGILRKLRKAGLGYVQQFVFISNSDFTKIMASQALDINTPLGLQNKVFIDISINLCIHGHNFRNMKKNDFIMQQDNVGHQYILYKANKVDGAQDGRLYEDPAKDTHCPIKTFFKYTSKLHPDSPFFWQTPKKTICSSEDEAWYNGGAIGIKNISSKMKKISMTAGCSRIYSNYSLRATGLRLQKRKSRVDASPQNCKPSPILSVETSVSSQIKQEVDRTGSMGYLNEFATTSRQDISREHVVILENHDLVEEGLQSIQAEDDQNDFYNKSLTNLKKRKGLLNTTHNHCTTQSDSDDSDDEETMEERIEKGLKSPFERLNERHFIAINKARTLLGQPHKPHCIVCSDPVVKRHRTKFFCEQCVLPMCPGVCFKRYHTMADYKTVCSEAYHNT